MKKINSIYIEFEPCMGSVWTDIRTDIANALRERGIGIITWETGICNVPHHTDETTDMF